MFVKRTSGALTYFVSPLLEKHGFRHGFFTRFGGVSTGVFDSLNVSAARKDQAGQTDSRAHIEENYRRALGVFGIAPENAATTKQQHTALVRTAGKEDGGRGVKADKNWDDGFDALIVRPDSPVRAACVKTADCVPVLLANIRTGAACAVHAGWRGTVAGIAEKAAAGLADGRPEDLVAAVGPAIGLCCYEVGEEVVSAVKNALRFRSANFDTDTLFMTVAACSLGGKVHVDLARANAAILTLCGVPEENIDLARICTACYTDGDTRPFFSHRASGGYSGTFVSLVEARV